MDYIEGFKITDTHKLSLYKVDKEALMARVCQAYNCQFFVDGFFNGKEEGEGGREGGRVVLNPRQSHSMYAQCAFILLIFPLPPSLPPFLPPSQLTRTRAT